MVATNPSEAITPESRAMARSGTFGWASARTRAPHVESYAAGISARYGGGWSGEMCRREQPASASAPATRALAVVVDPTVGVYEPSNAPFIEVVEGVDARPGRERDARFHRGIGRKDNVLVIPLDDLLQLLGELGALAVVLHYHAAVLQIVHPELGLHRPCVHAPGRDVREMRPGRRWLGVVRLVRLAALHVTVSLVGGFHPREIGCGAVREVTHSGADDDERGHDDRPPPLAPRSIRTAVGLPLRHRPPLAEACGSRTHLQLV